MGFRFASVAVLVALFGTGSLQAQSVGDLGGPSNLPPSGFKGQQFVDSRGCVFLKAGYGGQTTWVPRVGRDRRALCGYPPTFGAKPAIEVASAEEMAVQPASEPVAVAQPVPTKPAKPATVAPMAVAVAKPAATKVVVPVVVATAPAPYVEKAPAGTYEVTAGAGGGGRKIGCYTSAPVAERVKLRDGGTAVVCTRGDGTMTGWRPPIYPNGAGVGASLTDPVMLAQSGRDSGHRSAGRQGTEEAYADADADTIPAPPKGYVMAWKDDRLNPMRGKGTAEGWSDQDQVWTRKTPATLVKDGTKSKRKKKIVYVPAQSKVSVSSKGQPTADLAPKAQKKAAKGGAYIQIGTFGVPANAEGAAARLKGIGLPVARAKITSGGKPMQIVLAGPFASVADAKTALSMARGAGFGDAFLR